MSERLGAATDITAADLQAPGEALEPAQPDPDEVSSRPAGPAPTQRGQRLLALLAGVLAAGLGAALARGRLRATRPALPRAARRARLALLALNGRRGRPSLRRLRARQPAPAAQAAQRARSALRMLTVHAQQLASGAAPLADISRQAVRDSGRAGAAAAGRAAEAAAPVIASGGRAIARAGRGAAQLSAAAGQAGVRRTATARQVSAVVARYAIIRAAHLTAAGALRVAEAAEYTERGRQATAEPRYRFLHPWR